MDLPRRNYGLDVTRCIAVLLVFFIHAIGNIYNPELPFLWYFTFAGVELFFALSGFLIGKILLDIFIEKNGAISFKDLSRFWIRRWLRTLPLYYVVLAILVCIFPLSKFPYSFDWKSVFFLQNFNRVPPDFFGESWSLSIEEWFYLFFPTLLFLSGKILRSKPPKILFLSIVVSFILLILVLRTIHFNKDGWEFNIVIYRLDSIAYGVLACWVAKYVPVLQQRINLILMIGIVLIVLAMVVKFANLGVLGLAYYPIAGIGYSCVVFSLSFFKWRHQYKAVPLISKMSYSIYITHLSLIQYPMLNFLTPVSIIEKSLFFLVYVIFTCAVSLCTYYFVEKVGLFYRDKYFPGKT